jgi:secreted trypsin-like serine protease
MRIRIPPLCIVATALALVHCGSAGSGTDRGGSDSAISGGQIENGHPAVGFVQRKDTFCSGTLIAPQVVLTAGHCVETPVTGFYTGVGAPTSSSEQAAPNMVRHAVSDSAAYPKYSSTEDACPNTGNDVALVKLAQPITNIKPVPYARTKTQVGKKCVTVGFGDHEGASGKEWGRKRSATVIVEDLSPPAILTGEGNGTPASGDSGGPLLCDGTIVGVTSCGGSASNDPLGIEGPEEFYGRIDTIHEWIDETIAKWSRASR